MLFTYSFFPGRRRSRYPQDSSPFLPGGSIVLAGEDQVSALPAARRLQQTASEVVRLSLPLSIGQRAATVPACTFRYNALLAEGAYEPAH